MWYAWVKTYLQSAKEEFLFDFFAFSFFFLFSLRWILLSLAWIPCSTLNRAQSNHSLCSDVVRQWMNTQIFSPIHTLLPSFVHLRFCFCPIFDCRCCYYYFWSLVFHRDVLTNSICDLVPNYVVSVNVSLMIHCVRTLWICVCAHCFVTPHPYVLHFIAAQNTQISKTNFAYTRARIAHLRSKWKRFDF